MNGYLTRQEVYIMNCISISIYEMGNKEEALNLWSQLLEHYDTSVGYDIFNYHNIILILNYYNITSYYIKNYFKLAFYYIFYLFIFNLLF